MTPANLSAVPQYEAPKMSPEEIARNVYQRELRDMQLRVTDLKQGPAVNGVRRLLLTVVSTLEKGTAEFAALITGADVQMVRQRLADGSVQSVPMLSVKPEDAWGLAKALRADTSLLKEYGLDKLSEKARGKVSTKAVGDYER